MYSVTLHGSFGCHSIAGLMPIDDAMVGAAIARAMLIAEGHRVAGLHIRRVR